MSKPPVPRKPAPKRKAAAKPKAGRTPAAVPAAEITAPPLSEGARKTLALAARKGITPAPVPAPDARADGPGTFDPAAEADRLNLWRANKAGGHYYRPPMQPDAEEWLEQNANDLKRALRAAGVHCKAPEGESMSDFDRLLNHVGERRLVRAVIEEYAGYRAGIHQGATGRRLLVRCSPHDVEPADSGEVERWPLVHAILAGVFREAVPRFHAYQKTGYETRRAGKQTPGHVLFLIGPPGCGKSRVQHNILTPLLGGRSGDPSNFLGGKTEFNGDLFGTEHLLIEDPVFPDDFKTRDRIGKLVKALAANEQHTCNDKNFRAMPLRPFWRATWSQNEDDNSLKMIPPLGTFEGKIILLRCHKPEGVTFPTTDEEREIFANQIAAELPFYARFLLDWTIPPEMADARYRVSSFVDPTILRRLHDNSPEDSLLGSIDLALFGGEGQAPEGFEGTTAELSQKLQIRDSIWRSISAAYKATNVLGVALNALAKRYPERVELLPRRSYGNRYRIHPPAPEPADATPVPSADA